VLGTAGHRRIARQVAEVLTTQHRNHPAQLGLEPWRRVGDVESDDREVERQRAGGDPEPHPPRIRRREPRDLLHDERGGTQRQQQGARRDPRPVGHREQEGRGLQRVGQVARGPAVVLAHHQPGEPRRLAEPGLRAQLVDDRRRGQLVVRVEPQRHRTRFERRRAHWSWV
jgi:hypothetical protein